MVTVADLIIYTVSIHHSKEWPSRQFMRRFTSTHTQHIWADKSFAGPRVWNSLPAHLRDEEITLQVTTVSGVNLKCIAFNVARTRNATFIVPKNIGVGDGGKAPKKKSGNYFSGKYHVKFGNFVNFSGKKIRVF